MSYPLTTQIALLLGDLRGHMWSASRLKATQDRIRRQLAQDVYAIEQRQTLTCVSGQRFVTLPADHVQTFALTRGIFSASVRLLDPTSHIWWLTVSPAGERALTDVAPVGAILLGTTNIFWLRMTTPDATLLYVSPSVLGEILVSTVQPAGTGSTATIQLRDSTGTPWYPSVTNLGELRVSTTGAASLSATALALTPLQRMDPEARQRADPQQSNGAPRYFGIEGKLLELDPTPDATYQLEHLYYSSDVSLIDSPWDTVSVLGAVAHLITPSQGMAAMQQLMQMAQAEAALLQQIYVPGTYDGQRDARGAITGAVR
jgi:hypothetical protein